MNVQTDSSGNDYVEIGNIRVTKVPEVWGGERGAGLRIQAKRGDGGLFQGAEIPIEGDEERRQGMLAAVAWALFD